MTEPDESDTDAAENGLDYVIPAPSVVDPTDGRYEITAETELIVDDDRERPVASVLADVLRPATGYSLPVVEAGDRSSSTGIELRLSGESSLAEEGYVLAITDRGVTIRASTPAGLFMGVQTLRQLLPGRVERDETVSGPWRLPGGEVRDAPRFAYRGAMLDVARRFFTVDEVKRFVDFLSLYKLNHLHLHLTNDQGWRIEIDGRPLLTDIGARKAVGGGDGGYYTRDEYVDIVEYANDRFVTVVPEIDMPGHCTAALASEPELAPDGDPPPVYTGTDVGFSSFPVESEATYAFVRDVVESVAAVTPGPYLHVGGDEAEELSRDDYDRFVDRAISIVRDAGKRPMGWYEILNADPPSSTVVQYWSDQPDPEDADRLHRPIEAAVDAGHRFVVSPADRAYLDMKYDEDTALGLDWAGYTTVRDAYEWDSGATVEGVNEAAVLGVEAAVWTETIETVEDLEFMTFPRLPAVAEVGWSAAERDWDAFRSRLARQAPRWNALGIDFYRSPEVEWPID